MLELGMFRELRTEQKDAVSTLVSGKDLLALQPTGFWKSLEWYYDENCTFPSVAILEHKLKPLRGTYRGLVGHGIA